MDTETPLISVGKARAEFSELCSRVAYSGKRVVITRHGRPLVSITPLVEIDDRPPAVEASVRIQAHLITVWEALTSILAPKWWEGLRIEPHINGWVWDGVHDDWGKVVDVDPGYLIRTLWPGNQGEVDFTLAEEDDDAIVVTVTHHMDAEFWETKLQDLKRSCEAVRR